tara:strand:+ start:187 stop:387 length:201 start_codon:yes stop_codon:yes gene_type:complete
MKVFLTEVEKEGKRYAGPNILAETWEFAEEAATLNDLILVGELQEIVVDSTVMDSLEQNIEPPTLH